MRPQWLPQLPVCRFGVVVLAQGYRIWPWPSASTMMQIYSTSASTRAVRLGRTSPPSFVVSGVARRPRRPHWDASVEHNGPTAAGPLVPPSRHRNHDSPPRPNVEGVALGGLADRSVVAVVVDVVGSSLSVEIVAAGCGLAPSGCNALSPLTPCRQLAFAPRPLVSRVRLLVFARDRLGWRFLLTPCRVSICWCFVARLASRLLHPPSQRIPLGSGAVDCLLGIGAEFAALARACLVVSRRVSKLGVWLLWVAACPTDPCTIALNRTARLVCNVDHCRRHDYAAADDGYGADVVGDDDGHD